MIKKYKTSIIITSLLTLLPMFAGIAMWNRLPDTVTTHWNAAGNAGGTGPKALIVFAIPLIILALQWLCILVTARDKGNADQDPKALGMVLWIMPMLSVLVSTVTYLAAFGRVTEMNSVIPAFLGFMFALFGNFLPKCRRNRTLGIKVKWALQDDENWNATHRFGGRVWFVGGLLIMLSAGAFGEKSLYVAIGLILVAAFLPALYSYLYYRKQLKAGKVFEDTERSKDEKAKRISTVAVIIIIAVVAATMFTGSIEYTFGDESLTADSAYARAVAVPYDEIDSIEYRDTAVPGRRVMGYGSAKLLLGTFENNEFGTYTRYTYTGDKPCVVITSGDETLVLGGRDENEIQSVYNELLQRMK